MYIFIFIIGIIILHLIIKILFFFNDYSFEFIFDLNYDILEIEDVLTKAECNELIDISLKRGLENSALWNIDSSVTIDNTYRESSQLWLDNDIPLVSKIMKLSEKYSGFPTNKQELLQVVKYDIGGKFNSHYDACICGKNSTNCKNMNGLSGQRRTTFMIYLNDDYEGGETEFYFLNKKIKPKTGKAILFKNTDDYENVIFQSCHSGNPVINGNKWICTVWSHQNTYDNN
jgi:prolyl 4-hydroxylase